MNELNRYNLYCDESCHLQYDDSKVMCIGGIIVPNEKVGEYKECIKNIKRENGILHELKWNTISATHLEMYHQLLSFFFSSTMTFNCILIDKSCIGIPSMAREEYNSLYYSTIRRLVLLSVNHVQDNPNDFHVYLDLKDSHGAKKLRAVRSLLHKELVNGNVVSKIQNIRSHESVFLQLADIIIGAITYKARGLNESFAKSQVVQYIEELLDFDIRYASDAEDVKFIILNYQPKKRNG